MAKFTVGQRVKVVHGRLATLTEKEGEIKEIIPSSHQALSENSDEQFDEWANYVIEIDGQRVTVAGVNVKALDS